MTDRRDADSDAEVRLAPESVEQIARRVAELLSQSPRPARPRRLLSAAEVSEWWGVERSWVYAHADQLGARRLGAGQRPRLRFDPDEVAERLAALDPTSTRRRCGSPPIAADPHTTRLRRQAELWSPSKRSRSGRGPTPPASAPQIWPSAR